MFEQKRVISVTDHERGVMVRVLNDARNGALRGGKPTEDLDNLLIKAISRRCTPGSRVTMICRAIVTAS